MVKSNEEKTEFLVDLAQRYEAGLKSEEFRALQALSNSQQSEVEAEALSPQQIEELKEARAALYFLDDVRKSMKRTMKRKDGDTKISQQDHRRSTVIQGDEPTDSGRESNEVNNFADAPVKKLGRFEIIEMVGEGGFAKVFRAHDPVLKRDVALKIPKPKILVCDESVVRFRREAEATAILSHPSIVRVFEAGTVGPVAYIASEYFQSTTLAQWFDEQDETIDRKQSAKIIAQLADAIHHAHERNVIHRDLKPANVLIVEGPEMISRRLRVTDFGLAKQMDSLESTLTIDGAVIGTPAYMSPEQARAQNDVNASSDIYSLGVMLYQFLTGKLPCQGPNHLATIRLIEESKFQTPGSIDRTIPRDLESICLKCLEQRPADRYATAGDLRDDLNAWLDGKPIAARRPSLMTLATRWTRKNPVLTGALTFAFASLVVGLTIATLKWSESNIAIAKAARHAALAQITLDDMVGKVADELRDNPKFNELRTQLVQRTVQAQEQLLQEEPHDNKIKLETAQAKLRLAQLESSFGKFSQALKTVEEVNKIADTIDPTVISPNELDLLDFHSQMASAISYRGLYQGKKYQSILLELIPRLEKKGSYGHTEETRKQLLVVCLVDRADYISLGKSLKTWEAVAIRLREILNSFPANDRFAQLNRAKLFLSEAKKKRYNNAPAAKTALTKAKEVVESLLVEDPTSVNPRYLLAIIRKIAGDIARADDEFQLAQDELLPAQAELRKLKHQFPQFAKYADSYFSCSWELTRTHMALKQEKEMVAIWKEMASEFEKLNPNLAISARVTQTTALALKRLGLLVAETGEEHPKSYCEMALQLSMMYAENPPWVGCRRNLVGCHAAYATALRMVGEHEEGLKQSEKCLELLEILLKEYPTIFKHQSISEMYETHAVHSLNHNEFELAEQTAERLTSKLLEVLDPASGWREKLAYGQTAKCYLALLQGLDSLPVAERERAASYHRKWSKMVVDYFEKSAGKTIDWDSMLKDTGSLNETFVEQELVPAIEALVGEK
jgi:serine/threonine protein kinase/pterin-4a-carbinolamine dehydratase